MSYITTLITQENSIRLKNNNYKSYIKNIFITSDTWKSLGMPHFVHTMEYFYFALDIIVNNSDSFIIIDEPKVKYHYNYVYSFIDLLYNIRKNFIFTNNFNGIIHETHKFFHFCGITNINNSNQHGLKKYDEFIFLESNIKRKDYYYIWFQNLQTSTILYNSVFGQCDNFQGLKIGLINRKKESGRCIINENDILNAIKSNFNIDLDIEYFEGKSFNEQINFYKNHNIIISPHGAQLVGIPFSPDDSLIIEYCHEEHHPYYYFPGLSYSSNKYHVLICDNNNVFPKWKSPKYEKEGRQLKLNIECNIKKIINIIALYKNNNNSLADKKCYLY